MGVQIKSNTKEEEEYLSQEDESETCDDLESLESDASSSVSSASSDYSSSNWYEKMIHTVIFHSKNQMMGLYSKDSEAQIV